MVIMALDHVRDYFYFGSFLAANPLDIETTTPLLFFTRFISHYCAPIFIFLAGTSAFLYGSNKSKPELFKFLFTRGLWLVFLEIVVNNFIWFFDFNYGFMNFQVIWAIGFSMICLSFLIYLPKPVILFLAIGLIAGHNAFDGVMMEGQSIQSIVWYFLHQPHVLTYDETLKIRVGYPVIPWIGVIALGYLFGTWYQKEFDTCLRRKWLLITGLGSITLFFILRGFNIYGDLVPWLVQESTTKTVYSFFSVTKYPASLLYLCITLGPAMLFLYAFETTKNKLTDFFLVFGRVPLLYYFLHVLVIHSLAIIGILIFGGQWQDMILTAKGPSPNLLNYGYSLVVVYLVWIAVVLFLYPFCNKYMKYKANNKDKWWLSYL